MNLGGIYKDLGQLDQALASTLKSLKLNPDNSDAHMNLAASIKILATLIRLLLAHSNHSSSNLINPVPT